MKQIKELHCSSFLCYNEIGDFMLSKRLEAVASLVEENRSI